ncbi:unnamed protein product [Arabidopsis halleri]
MYMVRLITLIILLFSASTNTDSARVLHDYKSLSRNKGVWAPKVRTEIKGRAYGSVSARAGIKNSPPRGPN